MSKKIMIFCILLIIASTLYYFTRPPQPIEVSAYTVKKGTIQASVANTRVGTVKACNRAFLTPAIGGNVVDVLVSEGDIVKKQQPLLLFWSDNLVAQQQQFSAQIQVNIATASQHCELALGAKRDEQRLIKLSSTPSIVTKEQLDQAKTRTKAEQAACIAAQNSVDVAKASLENITATLEQTVIRAPFNGIIAEINAEIGEYVTPSPLCILTQPAIELLDDDCLYISAPIDEVDAPQIKMGMPVCVTFDAFPQPRCSGVVTRIAPYVMEKEKQARTVEVEVKLTPEQQQDLLPGYSADIQVILEERVDSLVIPSDAIMENSQVFLIDANNILSQKTIQTGLKNWQTTEVVSGLSEGERIVSENLHDSLSEGITVTVK